MTRRRTPRDLIIAALAQEGAGFAAAGVASLVGLVALLTRRPGGRAGGAALLTAGAVLGAGAARHRAQIAAARRDFPPPGVRVDAGGFAMHLLAEGPTGRGTVVWLPGGHAGGFSLKHLHDRLKAEVRSVLPDRAGTGWSDVGPFPRTTRREVDELARALVAAGEIGPFVLVGHSFGGLLAASFARHRPDLTAGVVLLDATPPDTIIYGFPHPDLSQTRREPLTRALARHVGIAKTAAERAQDAHPISQVFRDALGPETLAAIEATSRFAREGAAAASIYAELSPEGMARAAWDTAAYDGDLGNLPLFIVAPGNTDAEMAALPQADPRTARIYAITRERYMVTSSRAERIVTPVGTGHNFPYEAPDFTAEVVRRMVARVRAG